MSNTDKMLLSFHDVCLRESDQKLLHAPNWLNDNIISFCFEYFRQVQFKQHSSSVVFVPPDMVQLIKLVGAEASRSIVEPLNFSNADLILMPINDNDSKTDAGGAHWSLLVYRYVPFMIKINRNRSQT